MTPPARFIIQKDGSMNILVSDEGDYECTDDNGVDVILSKEQVSELTAMLIDTRRHHQPHPDAFAELETWLTDNSSLFKYEDPRYVKPGMRHKIITLGGYLKLREKISAIKQGREPE